MKTFKSLKFRKHLNPIMDGRQAILFFKNGYGVSVVCGSREYGFYSNGVDTYEIAIIKGTKKKFEIVTNTPITDDVIGFATAEQVTKVMEEVQKLKKNDNYGNKKTLLVSNL